MSSVKSAVPKTPGLKTKAAAAAKDPQQRMRKVRTASILMKQVSDPTRLQVVLMLAEGEMHVGALCEHLHQSQPAVSHHLALLRHGGIIAPRRQGKNNFYCLTELGAELARLVRVLMP
jgi:DNA-binding transcriptional ArsR family regulator